MNYGLIASIEELKSHIDRVRGTVIGIDIETGYHGADKEKASVHPETAILAGISFTNSTDWARYVPLGHDDADNLDNYRTAQLFWDLLAEGNAVAHNAVFELRNLSKWFREQLADDPERSEAVRAANGYFPIRSDSMVEAYLAADFERFGLKYLTSMMFDRLGNPVAKSEYFSRIDQMALINKIKDEAERKAALDRFDGHIQTELHELFTDLPKNRQKYLRFNTLALEPKVVDYACEDAVWCLAIHRVYYPQVSDRTLYPYESRIVTDVLPDMADEGIVFDWPLMRRTADKLRIFKDRYNAEIMANLSELTGETIAINLGSPDQVRSVLFGKLGLRTTVFTDKTRDLDFEDRVMSTSDIALRKLAKQHRVVEKILIWRNITKLLGTYLDKYEQQYNYADDGRVHSTLLSAFVRTGRFASADPNVQNLPKKYHFDLAEAVAAHEAGDEPPAGTCITFNFRDVITVPPGHYILGFDLSQAELRAIAGEAQETALLEAFANGEDVHRLTASLMLGILLDEITDEQRGIGKTMNFALLYGMSTKGLADRLGIDIDEAQSLMDKYFAGLPAIATYIQRQREFGQREGYVESKFGRKLPIWEYRSDKPWIRATGDRACVNYPIQGAATGDYMKIAMVNVVHAIRRAGLSGKVKLFMNIHDALEFYVDRSLKVEDVIAVIEPAVVFAVTGWPEMKADWHVAKKWGSPQEIVRDPSGKWVAKGAKVYDLTPEIEQTDDGDQVEVMPEVDETALHEAARPASGRRVIITLSALPERDRWQQFMDAMKQSPGENIVQVLTPAGEAQLDLTTKLRPEHRPIVATLLGMPDVQMAYAADLEGLAAGVQW